MRSKITPIHNARDKKLREILSADQWKEYEKMREEQRDSIRQLRVN